MAMMIIQYKYHAIALMEIVYERAAETDPKYAEEGKQVINKINEKYLEQGNKWISEFKKLLPYETQYNNSARGNRLYI